ncbi:MAG: hypothetical protein IPF67_11945 [Saprospiraceae bacterium]|nr:hypothetical protein [Candidatus Brachybacter algidus]
MKKTTITTNISYLNSQSPTERSQFSRPSATITQQLPKLGNMIISLSYQSEFNKRASVVADTLLASSFAFQILRLSIVNNFTKTLSQKYIRSAETITSLLTQNSISPITPKSMD